ncbi:MULTISPECIES: CHAP domain-containing protein [Lactococcus]|uniref:CHAP domain-containing protein n=2 Tax=Lactococcus TaxID=1357 RepID=A0AB35KEY5_9LACT|nr:MULTISPECIES: CHAP domain-containing protein [Lactococcus]ARE27141.1 CHAP domain-containing protein [Lactococcus cremoris]KZK52258.1 hypothetical protein FG2_0115 [Lactococcus cremoris]MDG5049610.1 CHAP domain-containing protein [Lactococcus lactis]PAL03022.1 CHAP domain-containing protein [Lactococcus lactis]WMB98743.1 CHAP domain-containing protein [Lactococcus cremoris]
MSDDFNDEIQNVDAEEEVKEAIDSAKRKVNYGKSGLQKIKQVKEAQKKAVKKTAQAKRAAQLFQKFYIANWVWTVPLTVLALFLLIFVFSSIGNETANQTDDTSNCVITAGSNKTDSDSDSDSGKSSAGSGELASLSDAQKKSAKAMFKELHETDGLSSDFASAVVGSAFQESRWGIHAGSSSAYGLYQFTPGSKFLDLDRSVYPDNEIGQTSYYVNNNILESVIPVYPANGKISLAYNGGNYSYSKGQIASVADANSNNDIVLLSAMVFGTMERGAPEYANFDLRVKASQWVLDNVAKVDVTKGSKDGDINKLKSATGEGTNIPGGNVINNDDSKSDDSKEALTACEQLQKKADDQSGPAKDVKDAVNKLKELVARKSTFGSGQCYSLSSYYLYLLTGKYNIGANGKSGSNPVEIPGSTLPAVSGGDVMDAYAIGDAYDWKSIGYKEIKVDDASKISDYQVGDIVNFTAQTNGGTMSVGSAGHTAVIVSVDTKNQKIGIDEQNIHGPSSPAQYDEFDVSKWVKNNVTSLVRKAS